MKKCQSVFVFTNKSRGPIYLVRCGFKRDHGSNHRSNPNYTKKIGRAIRWKERMW